MDKVIFILGPTGVGKSDISIKLAREFNGEIISSDSVQIFKGFDIGSAKITQDEMQNVVHHAIDICHPQDYFTVYDFVELTRTKIKEINSRGKLAVVVGGTGLYIKALIEGYNFGEADKHQDFRNQMQIITEEKGNQSLWNELNKVNPAMAEKIEPNNVKRVIRALEINLFGQAQEKENCTDFDYLLFALTLDRALLYERINKRVDIMVSQGLFNEVEGLLKQGISQDCQPMRAIGYKEVVGALQGEYDDEKAIELIKQHTRNYAKRQMTFLRSMQNVNNIDALDRDKAYQLINEKIKEFIGKEN